jgi:hydrogenase/urease accessory protein HupE
MTGRPLLALATFALTLALASAGAAFAHDARPLSVDVTEQGRDLYLARVRVPPTVAADNQPRVIWPSDCRVLNQRPADGPLAPDQTMAVVCKGGLPGRRLSVRYAIYNPSLATLFRLTGQDGRTLTRVLPPDRLDWDVPRAPSPAEVAAGYLKLGVEHIWTGIDHLLFVAGLLILAGSMKRVLMAITGFTVAHSITLSASALGLVQVPVPPVEAAIALSILFLAREIARPSPDGLARRYPVAVSSSFGLLHGFGFAAALREAGLPTGELATGLLCFNLGVEIGQIAFIALVLAAVLAARKAMQAARRPLWPAPARLAALSGYGLGVPAAFWFVQRLAALVS